jgi:hypothetical protein
MRPPQQAPPGSGLLPAKSLPWVMNGPKATSAKDKFLVMSRKGKRLGVAFASTGH